MIVDCCDSRPFRIYTEPDLSVTDSESFPTPVKMPKLSIVNSLLNAWRDDGFVMCKKGILI